MYGLTHRGPVVKISSSKDIAGRLIGGRGGGGCPQNLATCAPNRKIFNDMGDHLEQRSQTLGQAKNSNLGGLNSKLKWTNVEGAKKFKNFPGRLRRPGMVYKTVHLGFARNPLSPYYTGWLRWRHIVSVAVFLGDSKCLVAPLMLSVSWSASSTIIARGTVAITPATFLVQTRLMT